MVNHVFARLSDYLSSNRFSIQTKLTSSNTTRQKLCLPLCIGGAVALRWCSVPSVRKVAGRHVGTLARSYTPRCLCDVMRRPPCVAALQVILLYIACYHPFILYL